MISQPSRLSLKHNALIAEQDAGTVRIPLEDIATLVLDSPQITLSSYLLSALATEQVAVIFISDSHHPVGQLVPYLPHSRTLKILNSQLALSQPRKKRIWQTIVRRKIDNQAELLIEHGHDDHASRLNSLSRRVQSGDPANCEAQASRLYFPALFGRDFRRHQERFWNAALNYGYALIRAALARQLVSYGFVTALGLHHCNEQNAFNLADDLIEPFRPFVDAHVRTNFADEPDADLTPDDKRLLVKLLASDVALAPSDAGRCNMIAATEAVVISLVQRLRNKSTDLSLPRLDQQTVGT